MCFDDENVYYDEHMTLTFLMMNDDVDDESVYYDEHMTLTILMMKHDHISKMMLMKFC